MDFKVFNNKAIQNTVLQTLRKYLSMKMKKLELWKIMKYILSFLRVLRPLSRLGQLKLVLSIGQSGGPSREINLKFKIMTYLRTWSSTLRGVRSNRTLIKLRRSHNKSCLPLKKPRIKERPVACLNLLDRRWKFSAIVLCQKTRL